MMSKWVMYVEFRISICEFIAYILYVSYNVFLKDEPEAVIDPKLTILESAHTVGISIVDAYE